MKEDKMKEDKMKVYLMTINYYAWEDPEANGCVVEVFDSKEKAIDYMEQEVKREIEEEKEYGREFQESQRFPMFVSLVSQHSEYVEFEVIEKEIK